MISADAGSGKTTLVADFVRRQPRRAVWYQLDHADADPAVFLTYIAHGIREIENKFGEAIFAYLSEVGDDLLRYPEGAADLLLNELLRLVEEPLILILDDYHHLGRETPVHKMVDRLIQYPSDLLHLIVTTRELPPLAMMRRRSQSAAMLITRDDLLFTDDEVRNLFQKTLNVEIKDNVIFDYRSRTNGWVTALQLVRQQAEQKLHSGASIENLDLAEVLKQSERDISDYFAEEVYSHESPNIQQLLLRLSLLESIDTDACSKLFPEWESSTILRELANKNAFLTAAGDERAESYRFHPLFRDFLCRRARRELGRDNVAQEQNRLAEYYLTAKQWETALPYLLESENYTRAAEVIAETGQAWIAAGAFSSLRSFTEQIPANTLEQFPCALLHRAEVLRLQGEVREATGVLRRAIGLLQQKGDGRGEAEALHSLAAIERRRGNFQEAYSLLDKAQKFAEADSETFIKSANTRGLCLIVEGKWVEAEKQFRIALDAAERQSNDKYIRLVTHNLALAPGFRGDFAEALRWFERIFRDGSDKQLPQEAIGHLNVARLNLYLGKLDQAEKHLERSLDLCQLYNMRLLRGEIFEAYGNLHREKGDMPRADEFYRRAESAYVEAEIDISTKELDEERALFSMMRGDSARARHLLTTLIDARTKQADRSGINTAKLRLFQLDIREGRAADVTGEIEKIYEFFRKQGQYFYEAVAAMLLAEAQVEVGQTSKAIDSAKRALDLSARFDYDYWLRGEIRRNPQVFAVEEIAEILPADLKKELEYNANGPREAAAADVSVRVITDLTVNVLGHPEIHRDARKPFAPDAWTTKRARDIFCFIATSRDRRVAKDILIETFWGDDDPEAIEKNFHPTISHIRKALNSRQSLKQNFIVFRDGAYQLNPELSYTIDTEDLERFIADAEAAKRDKDTETFRHSLEAARTLYRGEYMSGVYDAWPEERRIYYSEQFLRVVTALAKLAHTEKRWTAAIKYAQEILKLDPFREDMHRVLMKVLAAQSKPAAVRKQFEELSSVLRDELGVEPAAETRRLFKELMKSDSPAV
jgi:ATP/maltotriose-dependent transcriptional regulator MalT/DNA-binding SARP family transcriptional activator